MKVSSKILMIFLATSMTISCAPSYQAPIGPAIPALGLWVDENGDYCMTESSVRKEWKFREDYKAYDKAVKEIVK